MVRKVLSVQLNDRKDVFTWLLNKGIFSASSMYKDLMKETNSYGHGVVWKLKLPLKIKVFLWYLRRGVILTKDNLGKRNWKGCTRCCLCSSEESIQHLFFNVKWLSSCGTLFVLLLAFILLIVLLTCLVLGGGVSPQSFKKQS